MQSGSIPAGSGRTELSATLIAYFGWAITKKVVDWTARILREQSEVAPALRYRAASLALLAAGRRRTQVIARSAQSMTPGCSIVEVRRHSSST